MNDDVKRDAEPAVSEKREEEALRQRMLAEEEADRAKKKAAVSSVLWSALLTVIKKAVDELPPVGRMQAEDDSPLDGIRDTDFAVEEVEDGVFEVTGGLVDFLSRSVTLSSYDSFSYFQKVMKDRGVIDALKAKGMKEGDTVVIADMEFEWLE